MSCPSRREFVAALLGSAAALACRSAAPAVPPGRLLVPGKRSGHWLRDRLGPEPSIPAERWRQVDVAIVGAGAAGLSAAWWLRQRGVESLLVLELDSEVGGTAQSGQSPTTAYPWGAHYIVAPTARQPALIRLLQQCGAVQLGSMGMAGTAGMAGSADSAPRLTSAALCPEPQERLFHAGRWHPGLYLHHGASAEDQQQRRQFDALVRRWVSFRDASGRRAFDLPTSLGSDSAELRALDQISFGQWLDRQGLRSPRLRWLTDYACRDDYGLRESGTSAWAGLMYFAARIDAPHAESREVLTWPEGNGRLVSQLAWGLGKRLQPQFTVTSVAMNDKIVEIRGEGLQGPEGVRARRAIVATPHFVARRLVERLRLHPAPQVDRGAWAVANLHLSAPPRSAPRDCPLAWDNVLRESPSLGYVLATHGRPGAGPTVLTWYYPFTGEGASVRRQLGSATREDWASVALTDIARAHPEIRALCQRIDVAFWGHGMVRPRPGHVFDPALRAAAQPVESIHFANTDLSAVALFEEAFAQGLRAAGEVLAALGGRG